LGQGWLLDFFDPPAAASPCHLTSPHLAYHLLGQQRAKRQLLSVALMMRYKWQLLQQFIFNINLHFQILVIFNYFIQNTISYFTLT